MPKPNPSPSPAAASEPGLRVIAKTARFYSAGITTPFTHEPRELPLASLTEAQIAELRADPWLLVQDCVIAAEPVPAAEGAA
jgi:hypothetical protein